MPLLSERSSLRSLVGRSQSAPTWQMISWDVLPDGVNIMEAHNTLTGDTYVIAWTTAGVAMVANAVPSSAITCAAVPAAP